MIHIAVEDWLKLGYTENQAGKLDALSKYGDSMQGIGAESASKQLEECMKVYHLNKYEVEEIVDKFNAIPN